MKKTKITIATVLAMAALLPLESCIGSFALTNKVLAWNRQVSENKFVNELVFLALWILPVYEVSALADTLILNSIEFWSNKNPMSAQTRVVDGKDARYLVKSDDKGYTIINLNDSSEVRLNFDKSSRSWSVAHNGHETTFMTFVDDTHVKMLAPNGRYTTVPLNQQGLMAYRQMTAASLWASK